MNQIPAFLVIVTAMLAPYGLAAALTYYFPRLAEPFRGFDHEDSRDVEVIDARR